MPRTYCPKRHLLDQYKLLLSGELLRLKEHADSSKDALEQPLSSAAGGVGQEATGLCYQRQEEQAGELEATDLKLDLTTHLTAAEEFVRAKLTPCARLASGLVGQAREQACRVRSSAKDLVLLLTKCRFG